MVIEYLGRPEASCGETRSIFYAVLDQKYIDKNEFEDLLDLYKMISSKTQRLMQSGAVPFKRQSKRSCNRV